MSSDDFWLRKGPSIKYIHNWEEDGEAHAKCVQLRTEGGVVTAHVYLRTYSIPFNDFGSIFIL